MFCWSATTATAAAGASGSVTPSDAAALLKAADEGNLEEARLLLRAGVPPDAGAPDGGATPAMHAAWAGHTDVLRTLLAAGACPNAVLAGKRARPLHLAAWAGHAEAAQVLLLFGASITTATASGATALLIAARVGHVDTMRVLVETGANMAALDAGGHTPLHLCAWAGYVEAIQLLLDNGAVALDWRRGGDGATPLHLASCGGHAGAVRQLLSAGANPNAVTAPAGSTPLHLAAQRALPEVVTALLEGGADPAARNSEGRSPLHELARCWEAEREEACRETARALLAASLAPSRRGSRGVLGMPAAPLEPLPSILREEAAQLVAANEAVAAPLAKPRRSSRRAASGEALLLSRPSPFATTKLTGSLAALAEDAAQPATPTRCCRSGARSLRRAALEERPGAHVLPARARSVRF